MTADNRQIITDFLHQNGITNAKNVEEIVSGFDLSRPVYRQFLEPGERLFQFLRNEELSRPVSQTGSWFCLAGASMDSLAIFGAGAGRRLQEFKVAHAVTGLEGTAAPLGRNWNWAGGGRGGGTQIFLPGHALFALEGVGTHQAP